MFNKKYEITKGEYGLHLCMFSAWSENIEKKAKSKKISELELNHAKGWPRGSDLSFLKNLKQLKYFELLDHWVSDISIINNLSELKELNITSNCNDVIDCSNFPHLERIGLEWFPNAKSLFDCVTLQRVFIYCCKIKDLSVFKKLRNLEYLSLKSPSIEAIGDISSLKNLKFLGIYNARKLVSLEGIEVLKDLEFLEIERCQKIPDIEPVRQLKNLKRLWIPNNGAIPTLKPVVNLPKLEAVLFHESTNIQDGNLKILNDLPKLKDVSFQERRHYNCKWEDLPMRCSKKELQKARQLLAKKYL